MTVCSTCISWNKGKAHLSTRLTHRSNKVHVLCEHKQVGHTVVTALDMSLASFLQAVVGSRESFFAHAPQSLLTQFQEVYWSTTISGSTEFTLFVARTIFDYVRILWITQMQTTLQKWCYFSFDPSPSHLCKIRYLSHRLSQIIPIPRI